MVEVSKSFNFDSNVWGQESSSAESKNAEQKENSAGAEDVLLMGNGGKKMNPEDFNLEPQKEKVQTTMFDDGLEKAWQEAEKAERRRLEEGFLMKRKSKKNRKNKVTIYLNDEERDYAMFISYYYGKPLTECFEESIRAKTEAFLTKSNEVIACCNEEEALKRLTFAENSLHDSRKCFIDDVNKDLRISEEQKRGIRRLFNTFEFPKISELYNDNDSVVEKLIKVGYYYPKAIQQFFDLHYEEFEKLKVKEFFSCYIKGFMKIAKRLEYLYYAVPAHKIKNSAGLNEDEVIFIREEGETWQL